MDRREVSVEYDGPCLRCTAGPHPAQLIAVLEQGTLLFGGPGDSTTTLMVTVSLVCPTTGESYEVTVSVPANAGERVLSARVAEPTTTEPTTTASTPTASDRPPAGRDPSASG
jgi:hypothetical protein